MVRWGVIKTILENVTVLPRVPLLSLPCDNREQDDLVDAVCSGLMRM